MDLSPAALRRSNPSGNLLRATILRWGLRALLEPCRS
jgi:hypothetical protein